MLEDQHTFGEPRVAQKVGGQVGLQPGSTTGSPPTYKCRYVLDTINTSKFVTLGTVSRLDPQSPIWRERWESKHPHPQRQRLAFRAIVEDYMNVTSVSQSFTPDNLSTFIRKSTHNIPLFEWVGDLNKSTKVKGGEGLPEECSKALCIQ